MSKDQSSRVFVTQEVKHGRVDYTPARSYGDIFFVTVMEFSPERMSIQNQVLMDEIRTRLASFNNAKDYVVITGSPIITAIVFMVLRERFTSLRILHWSNRDMAYSPVQIDLE